MSKSYAFERPLTLNLVFLCCLAGSILFALVGQIKGQHQSLCSTVAPAEVSATHSTHPSSAG